MNIIVTRPLEDAKSLATKLEALGHETVSLPLIKIVPRQNVNLPKNNYQAICLTSANGVRSLSHISSLSHIPVVAVGEQSLNAAHKAGLTNGIAAGGDVDGLVLYVMQNYHPQAGPMLYISGSETSGDLEGKLQKALFKVDRVVTYDAIVSDLSGKENDILKADAVMLYSPRSAKIWVHEILRLNIEPHVACMKHLCLSANVAATLPQSWHKKIAKSPTEANMLALLD
jgi:uroporphyrinogen-III synthase